MDPKIQNGLEDYLHRHNAGAKQKPQAMGLMGNAGSSFDGSAFEEALGAADEATRREVTAYRETAGMLHALQCPEDAPQPSANFYARIMERIEAERASNSFWSIFLNPQFSRRLVFASAALLILLGVTLATTDSTNVGLFGTAAPELVEAQMFGGGQDIAVETASQPIEAGLVSHDDAEGHDQILATLTTFQQ
jgi:hypothetical protein